MAKITKLSAQTKNKNRINVFIDGEFSFACSLDTALSLHLKENAEISDLEIERAKECGSYDLALSKGLNYVSKTMKTRRQVKTYLIGKGYDESTVKAVLEKLTEFGYINDVEYAKRYMETCSYNQGKRLSDYKLMNKGIKKSDIESASSEVEIDSKENAKNLAEKRMKNKEITKENILKTYRYLIGRGFSYEDAEYAVSFFKGEI